jgi:predicted RNA-binding Zn-ribbon protein involved in translation (DUF1610 family)
MDKDKHIATLNQKINDMLAMGGSQDDHYYRRGIEWARDAAQSEPEETCTYTHDEETDAWICSKCDNTWVFMESSTTPEENDMYYCPKCGRKLNEKAGE